MLNLQSVYFGQNHKDFDFSDYDIIRKVKRLYHKHSRQCENACNGTGYLNGQTYSLGTIDDRARREYGHSVKSGYVKDDVSVFDIEIDRIEDKIHQVLKKHADSLLIKVSERRQSRGDIQSTLHTHFERTDSSFRVEFQHDPRGHTVKLYYKEEMIQW